MRQASGQFQYPTLPEHALAELEMVTRMVLVPDRWEDPRDTPLEEIGDDIQPPLVAAEAGER